jgi:hypothetical protein
MPRSLALAAGTRKRLNQVDAAAERRKLDIVEDAARQKALYGKHIDDVRVLRSRGFVVSVEKRGSYLVGNQRCTGEELAAKADRERRLMGEAATVRTPAVTASGLKVGQVVALTPKAMNVHQCTLRTSPPRKLSGAAATAKAKAAEHSTDLGTKPRVVWLDLGLLDVDRRYQREITHGGAVHINRILRAFNWNRYQPIVVTQQADGRYAVIDGQHRLEAAKKHPLIDSLPCYIIDAPDLAAQAEIFVAVNSDRRALTNLQKFWASVTAGNREAAALAKACEAAGVTIPRTTPQGGLSPRTMIGPTVAVGLIGKLGRDAVVAAITLLATAWPNARSGFRTANLRAVATIASTPYSQKRLLATLKGLDPDALFVEALALAGESSTQRLSAATEKLIRKAMQP